MLWEICFVARGLYQESKKVIGVATEKRIRPTCSYDFCLMDIPSWTEENQSAMEELRRNLGLFLNPEYVEVQEDEYPPPSR